MSGSKALRTFGLPRQPRPCVQAGEEVALRGPDGPPLPPGRRSLLPGVDDPADRVAVVPGQLRDLGDGHPGGQGIPHGSR